MQARRRELPRLRRAWQRTVRRRLQQAQVWEFRTAALHSPLSVRRLRLAAGVAKREPLVRSQCPECAGRKVAGKVACLPGRPLATCWC